jgi:uncharacterized protein (TIGR02145 family)
MKISKIHLNNLRNDAHFQFHAEFRDLVAKHGAEALKVKPQFDAYMPLYDRVDEALKKIVKSEFTAKIHEADKARDEIYTGMAETNTAALKHFNPQTREAAARLKILFDTYGNVASKPLNEETSAIYNILQELHGGFASDAATVGISQWVAELQTRNVAFENLVKERFDETASRTDNKGAAMKTSEPPLSEPKFSELKNFQNNFVHHSPPSTKEFTMRKQLYKITHILPILLIGVQTIFTLSCSGGDDNDTPHPAPAISSSGGSSPSGESSPSGGSSSSGNLECGTWGEWSETTAPTCETAGERTRACTSDQSQTETEPVAKLEWGEWAVTTAPTCGAEGVETRTCPDNTSETHPITQIVYDNTTELCDSRDGKIYQFVLIDAQTWMAENLNYDVPSNDTDVCYDYNSDNCNTYGRLYNWATAMNGSASSTANPSGVQGVCPSGWHLPSDAEWNILMKFVNPSCSENANCANAATKLKATSGWTDCMGNPSGNNNGTDEFGFSALPGGAYFDNIGSTNAGCYGYWWSASEYNSSRAYRRYMDYYFDFAQYDSINKDLLFSVRCVKD